MILVCREVDRRLDEVWEKLQDSLRVQGLTKIELDERCAIFLEKCVEQALQKTEQ
jgi:hypothetical protein